MATETVRAGGLSLSSHTDTGASLFSLLFFELTPSLYQRKYLLTLLKGSFSYVPELHILDNS